MSAGGPTPELLDGRSVVAVVVAVLVRPQLWSTALGVLLRLAEPGWWRRPPHLPLPPADYLRFRMVTNYGGTRPTPRQLAGDVTTYLAWCRHAPQP